MTRGPIFALATARGRAAVAIVRLSGQGVEAAVTRLVRRRLPPRRATLCEIRDPTTAETLDQALVLWFPAPASFTGEDSAELHLHGGQAVIAAVLQALQAQGLRLAEPGEFTRRAFENDRLDLAQAEAVADLVEAETQAQRRQALGQLGGALSRRHAAWRETLIEALAQLEAAMDFPDEDLPDTMIESVREPLRVLARELQAAADDRRGERVREGYRVALIGAPNAGKSTLMNALAGRDMAIVTEIAGTTRDVLEAHLVLDGYRVILADTAGLRHVEERIEAEGVRRARAWAAAADLRMLVLDAASDDDAWRTAAAMMQPGDAMVANKADLPPGPACPTATTWAATSAVCVVSASTADTLELRDWLTSHVTGAMTGADAPTATRLRHREAMAQAQGHLRRAVDEEVAAELMAENIRLAARSLEGIAGRFDADAVLDRVFSTFCIGK